MRPENAENPIDIREPVAELCHAVGLDPSNVFELRVGVHELEAFVFLQNDEGSKYIDRASGLVAMGRSVFEVRA